MSTYGKQTAPATSVPLLDMSRSYHLLRDEILDALSSVCQSGRFLHGPDVTKLEESVADLTEVDHAIGCASGSDALLLALMALDVGPGAEVIVPSFTFFATASAVWRVGARPVFVDIEPDTFNLSPAAVARAITPATRAIIPVHLFGQCAAMTELNEIARRYELHVIEDVAQAIGARHAGRMAGSWGAIGCLSFYPTKNLGGFGDGGMLTTNDAEIADRLRLLASHGMRPRYYHQAVGINSRLDSLQAAVLNVKFPHLKLATHRRAANAARYCELAAAGLDQWVELPKTRPENEHVWNQFTIRVPHGQRDALRAQLASQGVGSEIYYPVPLHRQQCFQSLGYGEGSLPETERAASEVLSLPIFPELTDAELRTVIHAAFSHYRALPTASPRRAAA